MSDEVWWVKFMAVAGKYGTLFFFKTKQEAECGINSFKRMSPDEWSELGGPTSDFYSGDIIPIRPLRIERVEAPHDR